MLFICQGSVASSLQQLVHLSTSRLLCQQLFLRFFIFLSCLAKLSLMPAALKNKIISRLSPLISLRFLAAAPLLFPFPLLSLVLFRFRFASLSSRRAPLASYQTFSDLSIPFFKKFSFSFSQFRVSSFLLIFQFQSLAMFLASVSFRSCLHHCAFPSAYAFVLATRS